MEPAQIALSALALLLGGVLKGAIGAGAPVVAIPILSMIYGVPFAVAIFVLPNLVTNLWQGWHHRMHLRAPGFAVTFAVAGALGAGVGSILLARLPSDLLMRVVAVIVVGYVVFRLSRPAWQLSAHLARIWVFPAGLIGGVLQGAGGISAPISITFLNALKQERKTFIATISVYFVAMSLVQFPALMQLGILSPERLAISVVALVPLLLGMPIGAYLARRVSPVVFDRLLLVLLSVIAAKLIFAPAG